MDSVLIRRGERRDKDGGQREDGGGRAMGSEEEGTNRKASFGGGLGDGMIGVIK